MYEKFYYFVAGSSLLSERDMKPFLSLDEMKNAVYGHLYICLFDLHYGSTSLEGGEEEEQKEGEKTTATTVACRCSSKDDE